MTSIRIQGVTRHFGSSIAVNDVTLTVAAGELFFLLGPSGCGKTTLLRMLAGFVQPDSGDIFFGEERMTGVPPRGRGCALVFQTYALWPHMTVTKNVAYGLQVRGVARAEMAQRVADALKMVRMEEFGERRPNQLSGGQQQRVALARALVVKPRVLLLDEPLSNLDARLRDEMREEIRRLHRATGLTMVYVTHDQKEALALAGRLAVMERGRLVQVGTPLAVYNRPATRFVAGFLGDSNFLPGKVLQAGDGECTVDTAVGTLLGVPAQGQFTAGASVICSIRPQALTPVSSDGSGPNRIAAKVDQVAFFGEVLHVRLTAGPALPLEMVSLPHTADRLQPGDALTLSVAPAQVVVLRAGD